MVLGLVLGGIASAIAGSAVSSLASKSAYSQQMSYNSALNRESYQYARALNEQMYGLNYWQNKHNLENDMGLTNYNYQLQRESRQSTFQDTRKDLEASGYNPLLALGVQSSGMTPGITAGTSGQGSSSFSSADSSAVINAISSASSAYNNTRQIDQLIRQTDSNISSAKAQDIVNYNLAELYHSQERGQDINNTIQATYGLETANEQLKNLKKDGLLKDWQVKEIKQNIAESVVRSSNVSAQTNLYKQHYDIHKPEQNFSKSHPVAHGILNGIGKVGSAIGSMNPVRFNFK